jgi:signal transduction histidine kinase
MQETRGLTYQAGKVRPTLKQFSIASVALAVITTAAYRLRINLATVSLLLVVVVVIQARVGSFVSSVVVSIVASLLLAYIAPPADSFRVDDVFDIVAVGAFLFTSLVVAELVNRLRMMSEEARSSVNRKLIDAEEKVRARIGRELHDDIEQRLALLACNLARLTEELSDPANKGLNSMGGIGEQASAIAADVQVLAYELRPYKLEYLGVAVAVKSICKKFSEQHNVEIDFKSYHLPRILPVEASVSLIRVLQEGLENSAKHSGTRRFEVRLFGTVKAIHLTVHDSGIGFSVKTGMNTPGLGLISMVERMKLVGGKLLVDSQVQRGTTLLASVPLSSETSSGRPDS